MKQRATITTCDLADCEEHYVGDERPDGWLNVAVKSNDVDGTARMTFCSWTDLGAEAYVRAAAREEGVEPDDD